MAKIKEIMYQCGNCEEVYIQKIGLNERVISIEELHCLSCDSFNVMRRTYIKEEHYCKLREG